MLIFDTYDDGKLISLVAYYHGSYYSIIHILDHINISTLVY